MLTSLAHAALITSLSHVPCSRPPQLYRVGSKGDLVRLTTTRFLAPSGRSIDRRPTPPGPPGPGSPSPPPSADGPGREWRTAGGRRVPERGGVRPDVPVREAGRAAAALGAGAGAEGTAGEVLVRTGAFFDFGADWARRHPDAVKRYAGGGGAGEGGAGGYGELVAAVDRGLWADLEHWVLRYRFGPGGGPGSDAVDPRLAALAQVRTQTAVAAAPPPPIQ